MSVSVSFETGPAGQCHPPIEETEMLDSVFLVSGNSKLSCRRRVALRLQGLAVERIPESLARSFEGSLWSEPLATGTKS